MGQIPPREVGVALARSGCPAVEREGQPAPPGIPQVPKELVAMPPHQVEGFGPVHCQDDMLGLLRPAQPQAQTTQLGRIEHDLHRERAG
jgi:hypothetical protein